MRLHLYAAAALLGLAGCTPSGFTKAPEVSKYFKEALSKTTEESLNTVAVCVRPTDPPKIFTGWFATVVLANGQLYHYNLNLPESKEQPDKPTSKESALTLEFSTDSAQRRDRVIVLPLYGGCFEDPTAYLIQGSRVRWSTTGYVDSHIIFNTPFDDAVKLRLQRTAEAIELAVVADKKNDQVKATWGIKP